MRLGFHCLLGLSQSQWLKPYVEFNIKKNKSRKNGDKDAKVLYKLMNYAVSCKSMENLRKIINANIASNGKDYLKWISTPSYMSQKRWTMI